jgi:L-threonylcarbamoyladenylate synthase
MNIWQIKQSVRCLRNGGIIAYPTEAVYGLGCDPFNKNAVLKLLKLKKRAWQKGLIIIAANYAQLNKFICPIKDETILNKILANRSNAVTWLLPALKNLPYWLHGKHSTIAVRITTHPQVVALCQEFGGALVSTSANIAGKPAARTVLQVRQTFSYKKDIDYILAGKLNKQANPSEIRDALTNKIIRK